MLFAVTGVGCLFKIWIMRSKQGTRRFWFLESNITGVWNG